MKQERLVDKYLHKPGRPHWLRRCYRWMDYYGVRTWWEIAFCWSTLVPTMYALLYGFNIWFYMYQFGGIIVLISNAIYRSRHEQKPKHKNEASDEQMKTLSELFDGYEERPVAPPPPPPAPDRPTRDTSRKSYPPPPPTVPPPLKQNPGYSEATRETR